jgi:LmbE family N-acetylglucosaminyl deacetylase
LSENQNENKPESNSKDLKFNTALVFFAHPDDGEFMAGGSMARWAAEGKKVILCVVTNGSHGSNDPTVTREALIAARMKEQREAAAITGIHDVVFMGYEDCYVEDSHDLRRDMIREIRRYKPEVVVGPDPTMYFFDGQYVNHPDHRAVGLAVCAAINPGSSTVPLYREQLYDQGFGPHKARWLLLGFTPNPDYYVDISGQIDVKTRSVFVHDSQFPGAGSGSERGQEIANRVKDMAGMMGEQSGQGYKYAEAFKLLRLRGDYET